MQNPLYFVYLAPLKGSEKNKNIKKLLLWAKKKHVPVYKQEPAAKAGTLGVDELLKKKGIFRKKATVGECVIFGYCHNHLFSQSVQKLAENGFEVWVPVDAVEMAYAEELEIFLIELHKHGALMGNTQFILKKND